MILQTLHCRGGGGKFVVTQLIPAVNWLRDCFHSYRSVIDQETSPVYAVAFRPVLVVTLTAVVVGALRGEISDVGATPPPHTHTHTHTHTHRMQPDFFSVTAAIVPGRGVTDW